MKEKILMRVMAVILAVCLILTSATAVQIIRAYATESEEELTLEEEETHELDPEPYLEPDPAIPDPEPEPDNQPEPEPEHESEPDPFDYNLTCYEPNIRFGEVNKGDVVNAKQFSIVNVGKNAFPLTWEEIDPYTAFDMGSISYDLDVEPGESVVFSISPREGLVEGTYKASFIFFSENDIRRHHTTRVDASITVKKSMPYITNVEVRPGNVTVPTGKSYSFEAVVSGGNGYDASVIWSLTGNQSASTTISSNGTLTISAGETASSFGVIATSRQDPSVVGRAIVTVSSVDYVVSVKAQPTEGGAVAGGGSVKAGGSVSASASPNNNYVFLGWYEGETLVSSTGQLVINNISSDRNFVAKFERRTCYVKTNVNTSDGGTITQSTSVPYGSSFEITAKEREGYYFEGFVEDNRTISADRKIRLDNITSDRNITAVFKRNRCNVNVSVYPQDTGKYEGAGTYDKHSKVELRVKAYDGYEFYGWSINGQIVSTDSKYVIKDITGDVNVVANFMKKNVATYKIISGIANQGGNIVPSGDKVIQEGSSVTYNIVPQDGYKIAAVLVDGKNIGAVANYTFNNVRGAHTITASFDKKPVAAPKATTSQTPKSTNTAKKATTSKSAKTTAKEQKAKTEYNENTAAAGALPEQNVVEVEIPEETSLAGAEYEEDVYTEAIETDSSDEGNTTNSVIARHNFDEDLVRRLINDNAVLPLLREAFEEGTLQITVNNSYAVDKQETSVELYYSAPTLNNFENVIAETLTAEEKFAVLNGTPVSFNIDITENTATIDAASKQLMQKKVGYKPITYFDFMIMKTSEGTTSVIDKTAAELEVVVPIPEEFRKEGRKFYVIRNHNGVIDVLQDIGSDPTTVTFRTDRFSEYAIAYEVISVNNLILRFLIISIVSLILAVICFANLVHYKRKARLSRRKR